MAREHYYDEGEIPQEYDLFNAPPFEYMYYKLSSSIQSFILRATILDEEFENWIDYFRNKGWLYRPRPSQGKILCLAKDRDQTQSLLARDKKFMSILRETENKFRIGFNALSDLPH